MIGLLTWPYYLMLVGATSIFIVPLIHLLFRSADWTREPAHRVTPAPPRFFFEHRLRSTWRRTFRFWLLATPMSFIIGLISAHVSGAPSIEVQLLYGFGGAMYCTLLAGFSACLGLLFVARSAVRSWATIFVFLAASSLFCLSSELADPYGSIVFMTNPPRVVTPPPSSSLPQKSGGGMCVVMQKGPFNIRRNIHHGYDLLGRIAFAGFLSTLSGLAAFGLYRKRGDFWFRFDQLEQRGWE